MLPFNQYPYINETDLNLDWVIKQIKLYWNSLKDLEEWKVEHEVEYEELKSFQDAVIAGNFPPSLINAFNIWMQRNAYDLVGQLIKCMIVNITDDGHMIAYIPESWEDIIFNTTGLDITIVGQEYGRLVLSYDV